MSNKAKSSDNKHITKISAKPRSEEDKNPSKNPKKPVEATQKPAKATPEKESHTTAVSMKTTEKPAKKAKTNKNVQKLNNSEEKKPFVVFRPFIAFGHYLRDSWRELRQVRWPDRKSTWQMTLAVLIYCAIMMVFVLLLDMLFTFLFNLLMK